jgi:putative addiction module component (TIGR02574 family)
MVGQGLLSYLREHHQIPINLTALKNLSIAEKFELIELLWRDIESSNEPVPLNPKILAEANRRAAELRADPSIAIDREEMWRRVDAGRRP